jgi:single-strand DNA-binding protein
MISATIAGRIGQDAEMGQAGKATVCRFTVASQPKRDADTTWVRCTLFGARAEALCQYLRKGTSVAVSGKLSVRGYADKSGNAKAGVDLEVSDVCLLGGGSAASDAPRQEARRYGTSGAGASAKHAAPDFDDVGGDDEIPF